MPHFPIKKIKWAKWDIVMYPNGSLCDKVMNFSLYNRKTKFLIMPHLCLIFTDPTPTPSKREEVIILYYAY